MVPLQRGQVKVQKGLQTSKKCILKYSKADAFLDRPVLVIPQAFANIHCKMWERMLSDFARFLIWQPSINAGRYLKFTCHQMRESTSRAML
jgi:hypothetical protein